MVFKTCLALFILSMVGGILSLVIQYPEIGAWSGIASVFIFFVGIIDDIATRKMDEPKFVTANQESFSVSDFILFFVSLLFILMGYIGIFRAAKTVQNIMSLSDPWIVALVIVWVLELLMVLGMLFSFFRSRLQGKMSR